MPGSPSGNTPQESSNLDFLRASAVLAVYLNHLFYSFGNHGYRFFDWRWLGRVGVLAFFVHTSLVLMLSMRRTAAIQHSILHFYVRRAFRIYPLSIVCVIAVVLAGMPPDLWTVPERISPLIVASNLALVQNLVANNYSVLSPLWSLPYEVQMYVVLPFIYLVARRFRAVGVVALIICSAGAFFFFSVLNSSLMLTILRFFPCFLSGVLAFTLLDSSRKRWTGRVWIVAVSGLMLAGTVVLGLPSLSATVVGWFICVLIGVSIPFFQEIRSVRVRAASHTIAKYSYSIYLSHVPSMWISVHLLHGFAVRLVAMTLLTAVLSLAGYHWIEAPMIGAGKRFADRLFSPRPIPALVA